MCEGVVIFAPNPAGGSGGSMSCGWGNGAPDSCVATSQKLIASAFNVHVKSMK